MGASTSAESDAYDDAKVAAFRLAVIIGGVPADSEGAVLGDWFIRRVEAHRDGDADVIDLAELCISRAVAGAVVASPP